MSFRAEDGSTGHYHGVLVFESTGTTRCRLPAAAGLQMIAANGAPLETSTTSDTSTGRPASVVLAPSRRGSIQVTWVEISSGEPCVTPASLKVILPTDPHAIVVSWPAGHDLVCGHGAIATQPARPGVPRV